MKKEVEDVKNETLELLSKILDDISEKIENLKPANGSIKAEKIPQTMLIKQIAEKYDLAETDIYSFVSKMFIKKYPGVKVSAGRFGGIEKL